MSFCLSSKEAIMPNQIFLQLIAIGKEQRNIEYKQSTNWLGEFRAKIIKSVLAPTLSRLVEHFLV
jgi:hypothetical protein